MEEKARSFKNPICKGGGICLMQPRVFSSASGQGVRIPPKIKTECLRLGEILEHLRVAH